MSFDYQRMAQTAKRLLTKLGAPAVLSREGGDGTYNPATGQVEGGGTQTWDCMAYVGNFDDQDIDGTLIQAGDANVMIAPDIAVAPKNGDTLTTASGRVMTVVRVKTADPIGGPVLYYVVQARG